MPVPSRAHAAAVEGIASRRRERILRRRGISGTGSAQNAGSPAASSGCRPPSRGRCRVQQMLLHLAMLDATWIATAREKRRSTAASAQRRRVSGETWRKALLVSGIASSLLYALMIWGIRYEGYNLISQVPSELTAIGAPTQRIWAWLGAIYTVLVAAFGCGVWRSARSNPPLRIVGGLLLAYASLGLLWPFAPMHQREVLAAGGRTWSDTAHVVLGGVTVFLMFFAIGFGATAFGKRFRLYSIGTVVALLTFGGLTFIEAPRLQGNLPTPWIGLFERINISVFLLWVVVLAAILWRPVRAQGETP